MSSSVRIFFQNGLHFAVFEVSDPIFCMQPTILQMFWGVLKKPPKMALNVILRGGAESAPPGPNVKSKYPGPDRVKDWYKVTPASFISIIKYDQTSLFPSRTTTKLLFSLIKYDQTSFISLVKYDQSSFISLKNYDQRVQQFGLKHLFLLYKSKK